MVTQGQLLRHSTVSPNDRLTAGGNVGFPPIADIPGEGPLPTDTVEKVGLARCRRFNPPKLARLPEEQHRKRHAPDDCLGRATDDQAAQRRVTIGAHHNEVGASLKGEGFELS